eukprot:scaffold1852_cov244-Pinguiococcus_pyrenoidosus.AAC.5
MKLGSSIDLSDVGTHPALDGAVGAELAALAKDAAMRSLRRQARADADESNLTGASHGAPPHLEIGIDDIRAAMNSLGS